MTVTVYHLLSSKYDTLLDVSDNKDDHESKWPIRQLISNMVLRGSNTGLLGSLVSKYLFIRTADSEIVHTRLINSQKCVTYPNC